MLTALLSLLGIGGIGAATVAFPAFGALLLGFGRSIFGFLAKIPWQVYVAAALAILIAFLVISRSHEIARADKAEARIELVCRAVRDVAGKPRQDCRLNEMQIRALGKTIADLEGAIRRQNAAVNAMALKTVQQQQLAATALRAATGRAQAAQAVAQRLDQSARTGPLRTAPAGVCEPSPALKQQWH